MSYAKRMSQLPTTPAQQLIVLAIVAVIAFSLGIATENFRHTALSTTAADRPSQAAVSQGEADVAHRSPALVRVPYDAGWELYDNGWAGGPAAERAPAVVRVPYEAGWELYDGGWAGGPARQMVTQRGSALVRVPYEAGWELYDGGWAGGPNTLQPGTPGQ